MKWEVPVGEVHQLRPKYRSRITIHLNVVTEMEMDPQELDDYGDGLADMMLTNAVEVLEDVPGTVGMTAEAVPQEEGGPLDARCERDGCDNRQWPGCQPFCSGCSDGMPR